jgi:hypothetical protein
VSNRAGHAQSCVSSIMTADLIHCRTILPGSLCFSNETTQRKCNTIGGGNILPLRTPVNWKSAKTFQLAKLIYRAFKMKLGCCQTAQVLLFPVNHKLHQDCRQQTTLKHSYSKHRHDVGTYARRKHMLKG